MNCACPIIVDDKCAVCGEPYQVQGVYQKRGTRTFIRRGGDEHSEGVVSWCEVTKNASGYWEYVGTTPYQENGLYLTDEEVLYSDKWVEVA